MHSPNSVLTPSAPQSLLCLCWLHDTCLASTSRTALSQSSAATELQGGSYLTSSDRQAVLKIATKLNEVTKKPSVFVSIAVIHQSAPVFLQTCLVAYKDSLCRLERSLREKKTARIVFRKVCNVFWNGEGIERCHGNC